MDETHDDNDEDDADDDDDDDEEEEDEHENCIYSWNTMCPLIANVSNWLATNI